jgi:hypothetical protein
MCRVYRQRRTAPQTISMSILHSTFQSFPSPPSVTTSKIRLVILSLPPTPTVPYVSPQGLVFLKCSTMSPHDHVTLLIQNLLDTPLYVGIPFVLLHSNASPCACFWVTKFGLGPGATEEQEASFLMDCIAYLDGNNKVQSYSYFIVGKGEN